MIQQINSVLTAQKTDILILEHVERNLPLISNKCGKAPLSNLIRSKKMLFSSMTFIFIFLPVVLAAYYLLRPAYRNTVLLMASLFFYAWGEPRYLLIMLFTITINYCGAMLIDTYRSRAKLILCLSILANLGILVYFKYTNFIFENINVFLLPAENPEEKFP